MVITSFRALVAESRIKPGFLDAAAARSMTIKANDESFNQNLPQQLSYPENDRRQAQRRQNDRSGKYDRRRNRCAHCKHFTAPSVESAEVLGTCLAHNTPMAAMAFACPVFESHS